MAVYQEIFDAIIEGDMGGIEEIVERALAEGNDAVAFNINDLYIIPYTMQ